jgi:hypothetical protein
MGVVYQAWQPKLKRHVALKMILAGAHAGPQDLARFRAEGQAAASLHHNNIVQIYEIGEHAGLPFFTLEWVDGGSLAARLKGKPWSNRKAAQLIEQLARAIHVAHRARIIHRDLKPANVLLTKDAIPIPKITDFGLAKQMDASVAQTQSGAIMGTPSYMAPEQAEGKKDVGPRTDVYALGAILYELLTGRPPFHSANPVDTIMQVIVEEPVPPSQRVPRVARDLETICLKCLQKNPRKRYDSALGLAEDLRRFQGEEPIRARSVNVLERIWRWYSRHTRLALVGAAAVLSLLIGSGMALHFAVEARAMARDAAAQKELAADALAKAQTVAERADQKAATAAKRVQHLEEEKRHLNHQLYAARMREVQRAGDDNDPELVRDLLQAVHLERPDEEDDLHGFEWQYWNYRKSNDRPRPPVVIGHGRIIGLAFRLYDHRLASASADGHLMLWDWLAGKDTLTDPVPLGAVTRVTFAPGGQHLAACCDGSTSAQGQKVPGGVRKCNMATRRASKSLVAWRLGNQVFSLAFSPDGTLLASGWQDGKVRVCIEKDISANANDPEDRIEVKEEYAWHAGAVTALAYSPDGKLLASGSDDQTVLVRDVTPATPDPSTAKQVRIARQSAVSGVAFSPDNRHVAVAGEDQLIKIYDITNASNVVTIPGHKHPVAALAYSPDGKRLASASTDEMVKVWDVVTGSEVLTLRPKCGPLGALAFSPDGKRLACGSATGKVVVWEAGSRGGD